MKNVKFYFLILILFFLYQNLLSKEFSFYYSEDDKYQLIIRGNIKVYYNNKYIGLQTREMKGILKVNKLSSNKVNINGSVYHYNKAIRDNIKRGTSSKRPDMPLYGWKMEDCKEQINEV